jgi:zinc/manganese transport system permease protein
VAVALMTTWLGLFVAFYEPYPVSFFMTSIVFVLYLLARLNNRIMKDKTIYRTISER